MRPVIWSSDSQQDILEILRYIATDNPFAADRLVDAIEETGNKLGEFATGRPGRVTNVYEKPLVRHPYIIAYTLGQVAGRESVVILRVIHTARDWPAGEWPSGHKS